MSRVFKTHDRYWSFIAVFGDYLPWGVHRSNGGDRSNYPEHSGRILDLKDGKDSGVNYFKERIEPVLREAIAIAVVPSHDPKSQSAGLKKLAAELTKSGNRVDASRCLVRTHKIDKLAHGGNREKQVHLESIVVMRPEVIRGRDVLLLDDVAKTGNSLAACAELLLRAGAYSVECGAIGKT